MTVSCPPGRTGARADPALTMSESWIEIASQPSSSSLSSIGDEIVTTGLRVGQHRRRRYFAQHQAAAGVASPGRVAAARSARHGQTSSQEEYDETESDEDQLMTSSAENVQAPAPGLPTQQTAVGPAAVSDDDDDDDEATALGRPSSSPTFRPQPNAFSHPPSHLQHRSQSASSAAPHHHAPFHRPSMSQRSQTRVHRRAPNFMSPSYREDNDAALRASLTTLLSCAAAARGLPKRDDAIAGPSGTGAGLRPSTQPVDLRLVPESGLMAEDEEAAAPSAPPQRNSGNKIPARTASNSSAPSGPASTSSREEAAGISRRAAATQSRSARATKKKRTAGLAADAESTFISPTLLTWVVSAGVVVLVSVVSFGAGYVIGREVGTQEAAMGMGAGGGGAAASGAANATSCGRELARSTTSGGTLRRFKWGAGMARNIVAS